MIIWLRQCMKIMGRSEFAAGVGCGHCRVSGQWSSLIPFLTVTWPSSAGMAALSTWSCCAASSAKPRCLPPTATTATAATPKPNPAPSPETELLKMEKGPGSLGSSPGHQAARTARRSQAQSTGMGTAPRWRWRLLSQRPLKQRATGKSSTRALEHRTRAGCQMLACQTLGTRLPRYVCFGSSREESSKCASKLCWFLNNSLVSVLWPWAELVGDKTSCHGTRLWGGV